MPLAAARRGRPGRRADRLIRKPGDLPALKMNGRTGCSATGRWRRGAMRLPVSSASPMRLSLKERAAMRAVLHVCTTCRGLEPGPDSLAGEHRRPGALLLEALAGAVPEAVELRGVECLSACAQGCSVALTGPGKWSYVYGRLTPEDAADILSGAAAYAASADGIVPWRERPAIFRKQSLARIPPLTIPQE